MAVTTLAKNEQTTNPTMTRVEFYSILRGIGFKQNSRSFEEYGCTKKHILDEGEWRGKNYPIVYSWIKDYIGV